MTWTTDRQNPQPPFGRKAARWFRARLAAYLEEVAFRDAARKVTSRDLLPHAVEWYASQPRRFVRWVAATRYSGPGFASGGWELAADAVLDAFPQALTEAQRAAAAAVSAQFSTLDEWLAADLAGTIARAPLGGSASLDAETRTKLGAASYRRQLWWPLTCPECGAGWRRRMETRGAGFVVPVAADRQATRCPDCRAKRRQGRRAAS